MFQIEIRFHIELHGNSKLSMTSCPPSSGFDILEFPQHFPLSAWVAGLAPGGSPKSYVDVPARPRKSDFL